MSNIQGKVVLITGASSGIGEAAARLIAAKGAYVVLGARRIERLEMLAADIEAQGGSARFRALDVTDALDMQAFADFAKHAFGKIDVIINNAGVMPLSPLAAVNIAEWNQMLDVNVRGVLHGIAAVLPSMQAQGHGQIINISSIGGLAVSPTAAVYCATKFAVRAISDGLRQETDKIRVTVVCPGVVESELADSISDETAREAMNAFRKVALEPDAIARALVYAIEQPDGVDVSEIVVRPTGSAY
ncbi:putative clavulanic acid dehydrogenase, SDR superfamily [Pseudomonas syringae pv. atrofaciens]|uniref:SDR family NAD(P)-dependent oxidoreductase n=1 Tax=Pseudomonas syringae pv. atrofaciens TaxID=192087 RepID=A0AAD0N0D4_PSESX|nr:SDR family oxidoreductase [Pseudomonas syringae]AVX25267.1 SDR family NAD(P)-dependent oxidoreductase [Pseudomonas syringae pv. atrofaciens]KMY01757.1 oxidoreductase [Pseudomonas syringae KCTC 12500]KPW08228.1 putative clavulanic acid dehydrogenase, SDR superfamily [Pseudomonas syringae pv. atrofaciens]KPY73026.1 putative clavulanic acid dehydrogenase, SDR superfamily [Pseudomonas syringae pv. syringae]POR84904.1 oxidoreductase [Pseudomonas syringae pv. syringae]